MKKIISYSHILIGLIGAVGIDNFDGHASYQNFSYTVDGR